MHLFLRQDISLQLADRSQGSNYTGSKALSILMGAPVVGSFVLAGLLAGGTFLGAQMSQFIPQNLAGLSFVAYIGILGVAILAQKGILSAISKGRMCYLEKSSLRTLFCAKVGVDGTSDNHDLSQMLSEDTLYRLLNLTEDDEDHKEFVKLMISKIHASQEPSHPVYYGEFENNKSKQSLLSEVTEKLADFRVKINEQHLEELIFVNCQNFLSKILEKINQLLAPERLAIQPPISRREDLVELFHYVCRYNLIGEIYIGRSTGSHRSNFRSYSWLVARRFY